ncbi:hypothetical protein [Williamwhitmania taraxaci]|nr:hypothetical protein [Williamwhitmania taraxaci]
MKYFAEIITLISWPVVIYVSYRLAVWAVLKFEASEHDKVDE